MAVDVKFIASQAPSRRIAMRKAATPTLPPATPGSFKAERVQLAPQPVRKHPSPRFKSERVQLQLAQMPSWKLIETRAGLIRTFELPSDSRAFALASAMGSLFGARKKGLISVHQNRLTVRVEAPPDREVSFAEIAFARRVSRVIEEFRKGWESR
jgi:pterin-4a-carbinolamine dehydratase